MAYLNHVMGADKILKTGIAHGTAQVVIITTVQVAVVALGSSSAVS